MELHQACNDVYIDNNDNDNNVNPAEFVEVVSW
mgnify:CR=1 FL=1